MARKIKMINPFYYLKGRYLVYYLILAGISLALIALAIVGCVFKSIPILASAFFAYVVLGEISNMFIAYLTQSFFEN